MQWVRSTRPPPHPEGAARPAGSPAHARYLAERVQAIQEEGRRRLAGVPSGVDLARARARLRHGRPALTGRDIEADWVAVADLCRLLGTTLRGSPDVRPPSRVESDRLGRADAVRDEFRRWFSAGSSPGESSVRQVLRLAAPAVLHRYAEELRPVVSAVHWDRHCCPVCGADPDLVLVAPTGVRSFVCRRCDSRWGSHTARCPFCGTGEPQDLAYYRGADCLYRLHACDQCRRYVKTVYRSRPKACESFPAHRMLTAGLERVAADQGYRP